mmetsp:Transcript_105131/g.186247  ORF Transcript_105131/g.186247 Transcript_105131/m.186247 type:complete len:206 (-) Transcript_105131:56-673(-)
MRRSPLQDVRDAIAVAIRSRHQQICTAIAVYINADSCHGGRLLQRALQDIWDTIAVAVRTRDEQICPAVAVHINTHCGNWCCLEWSSLRKKARCFSISLGKPKRWPSLQSQANVSSQARVTVAQVSLQCIRDAIMVVVCSRDVNIRPTIVIHIKANSSDRRRVRDALVERLFHWEATVLQWWNAHSRFGSSSVSSSGIVCRHHEV